MIFYKDEDYAVYFSKLKDVTPTEQQELMNSYFSTFNNYYFKLIVVSLVCLVLYTIFRFSKPYISHLFKVMAMPKAEVDETFDIKLNQYLNRSASNDLFRTLDEEGKEFVAKVLVLGSKGLYFFESLFQLLANQVLKHNVKKAFLLSPVSTTGFSLASFHNFAFNFDEINKPAIKSLNKLSVEELYSLHNLYSSQLNKLAGYEDVSGFIKWFNEYKKPVTNHKTMADRSFQKHINFKKADDQGFKNSFFRSALTGVEAFDAYILYKTPETVLDNCDYSRLVTESMGLDIEDKPTLQQWFTFFQNYEEFKDMPIEWWKELL